MEPRDFYQLARELVAREDEAARRTAVSRAYYAALNHAARAVRRMGIQLPDDYHFHDVVADNIVQVEPGLRSELEYLRMERGKADYCVWDPWLTDDVHDILEVADHVMTRIDEKT